MSYHIGDYKQDAPTHGGWFVGKFIEQGAAKTDDVEIKYWEYPAGSVEHDTKISAIFECTLFLAGHSRGLIGDEIREFKAGDYVAIQPGTPNNLILEIYEPVVGITVKAPSDPSAKKVIDHPDLNQV